MVKYEPVESLEYPGFYKIPAYDRYVLSKEGRVINVLEGRELRGTVTPKGYVQFRLTYKPGKAITWGRHRLIAFVFRHPGVDVENLVVNHLDGVPGNDDLDNLEWTTNQGNVEHAGRMELTTKCVPISVRDVYTGKVEEYPSIQAYASKMGWSKDTVNWRVKIGETRIFPEGKQYRKASVKTPWYVHEDVDRSLLENFNRQKILVKFHPSGEVKEFQSQAEAAQHLSVCTASISNWYRLQHQPVLPGLVQFKLAEDPSPWRKVEDPYLEYEMSTGKKAIRVVDHDTGEETIYLSHRECGIARGLKNTTLLYRLKSKGLKVFVDGCTYAYYSESI